MVKWMQPPWDLDPEQWSSKWWIVTESAYLDQWREWFVSLPDADQNAYRAANQPPAESDQFYSIFGTPRYDPVTEAEKHRDAEGYLPAPWVVFPSIPKGSMHWRMAPGEDYWHVFWRWFMELPPEARASVRARYPEPAVVPEGYYPWLGTYDHMEKHYGNG
jgi:hypothetical protein